MKKLIIAFSLITIAYSSGYAQETKIISDCTVTYDVSVEDSKTEPQLAKSLEGSTKVLYIKGTKTRSDLITPNFKQTTLFDTKSDTTIVLRELGSTKYISYLNESKSNEKNKKYEGIQFTNTNEKKTILGYDCIKVVAKLNDGSTYDVFYTTTIIPTNREYEYQFKDLAGFVLEYEAESEDGKTRVKYAASKITLLPVPVAKFDLPTSGYRVL